MFHFAGIGDIVPSIEQPIEYMDVNVQGTVRVLECARARQGRKFVYAASSSCYGLAATPTREDHPIAPQVSLRAVEISGRAGRVPLDKVYRLPVNSIRIFNAYGPRVRTTGAYGAVFGVFFEQKLAGKPFTVVGDGTQSRDFVYVTDVAEAFLPPRRPTGLGDRFQRRRRQSADGQSAGRADRRPSRLRAQAAGRARLHLGRHHEDHRAMLGWQPQVPFEEACGA